jgi:putative nucleotidyltransferase with HDIG domain
MDISPDDVWKQLFINLSRHLDTKITHSGTHSTHVAYWVKVIARKLDIPKDDVQIIFWASLLHDIGKISIPDDILAKNGPLTDEEWILMKMHPIVGANMVNSLHSLSQTAQVIQAHQEKYDGTGYPKGLKGDEIPLGARILAVADAYVAMTNERVYRTACSHSEAINELKAKKGQQFDPAIVDSFIEVINSYPYQ